MVRGGTVQGEEGREIQQGERKEGIHRAGRGRGGGGREGEREEEDLSSAFH